MAWIESHTVLIRHRKVLQLASALSVKPVVVLGHLHALWHSVLEQQEDGDLTTWPDDMIAHAASYEGEAEKFVTCLQDKNWLDGKLVHDWIEYAGLFLMKKYSTSNVEKLREIWKTHGLKYGKRDSKSLNRIANRKRTESEPKANLPNLTRPNLTNLTKPCKRAQQLLELESFEVTEETHDWAMKELKVKIPPETLVEFKDFWRESKRLRTDWDATFKNRVRQLVGFKVLIPVSTATPLSYPCQSRVQDGRFLKACGKPSITGSLITARCKDCERTPV